MGQGRQGEEPSVEYKHMNLGVCRYGLGACFKGGFCQCKTPAPVSGSVSNKL